MHYIGPLYRHPLEADSVLVELTVGCSHNRCAFCSFFNDVKFKPVPFEHIEADLDEVRRRNPGALRFFGCGGDAFCLPPHRLKRIASAFYERFPGATMGMYARISNLRNKTVDDLRALRAMGIDGIYIGMESADDAVLNRMNKGYDAAEVLEACLKLEEAGIGYYLIYLGGLAGRGNCVASAGISAAVINQLHPAWLGLSTCTPVPDTQLYLDVMRGSYDPPTEKERLEESMELLRALTVETRLYGLSRSNTVQLTGELPKDKGDMLQLLSAAHGMLDHTAEDEIAEWRKSFQSI